MPDKKISLEIQSLIDAQDHPFVLIDDNYNIVAANKSYQQAYGISGDQIVGRKCHAVSHHSDKPCHMNGEDCPHKQVFETGEAHQVLHIHYDAQAQPEHVRIKGSPIHGQDGSLYLGEAVFPLASSSDLKSEQYSLVGESPTFQRCIEELTRAAETSVPVLITGESGVGKDMSAHYIHRRSERAGRSISMVDCSAISESMFESELFGHERGAFTGCVGRRHGLFEQADGGTLFFNEIGDLPASMQGRLLRAMESGEFRRVGGRETLVADVRILSATSKNLRTLVAADQFRADLYYRIAGIICEIPTLRERQSDIPLLAKTLIQRDGHEHNHTYSLTDDAIDKLCEYDYPGNIRELRNTLQRAAVLSTNGVITSDEIHYDEMRIDRRSHSQKSLPGTAETPSMKGVESQYIAELLAEHQGKRARVAEVLGISERTLYRKIKQYGLQSIGRH